MTGFEKYVLALCLIVYVMLTAVFSFMIWKLFRMTIVMIREGLLDKKIQSERYRQLSESGVMQVISSILSILVAAGLLFVFGFSLYLKINDGKYFEDVPVMRVVQSASMQKKHEKNKYLVENNLDDQFSMFDIIYVYKVPAEEELKLYDIVIYEVDDGIKLAHRIVGIEEPNKQHPNERRFILQGDAVERPDAYLVEYSQIEAIYRGESIPFVGSFIIFMQSPAGWMCIILSVFAILSSIVIERKLVREKKKRREEIGGSLYLYDWNIK